MTQSWICPSLSWDARRNVRCERGLDAAEAALLNTQSDMAFPFNSRLGMHLTLLLSPGLHASGAEAMVYPAATGHLSPVLRSEKVSAKFCKFVYRSEEPFPKCQAHWGPQTKWWIPLPVGTRSGKCWAHICNPGPARGR